MSIVKMHTLMKTPENVLTYEGCPKKAIQLRLAIIGAKKTSRYVQKLNLFA